MHIAWKNPYLVMHHGTSLKVLASIHTSIISSVMEFLAFKPYGPIKSYVEEVMYRTAHIAVESDIRVC